MYLSLIPSSSAALVLAIAVLAMLTNAQPLSNQPKNTQNCSNASNLHYNAISKLFLNVIRLANDTEKTAFSKLIFHKKVRGRLNSFGTFDTKETLSYFRYLAPIAVPTLDLKAVNYNIRNFVSDCSTAATTIDIEYASNVATRKNVTIQGFWRFRNRRIIGYDLDLINFGKFTNSWFSQNQSAEVFFQKAASYICTKAESHCKTPNEQYTSRDDCLAFLASQAIPNFDYLNSNTLACRLMYAELVSREPNKYCPSIGKSGGSHCLDST